MPAKTNNTPENVIYATVHNVDQSTPKHFILQYAMIINFIKANIDKKGYKIKEVEYKTSADLSLINGVLILEKEENEEFNMIFTFTYGYNKLGKFKCAIGTYNEHGDVYKIPTPFIKSPPGVIKDVSTLLNHIEKVLHTIPAVKQNIEAFNDVLSYDECNNLSLKQRSAIVGELFIETDLITTNQTASIKNETLQMKNVDTLFHFYNVTARAVLESHPLTFIEDHQRLYIYYLNKIKSFANEKIKTTVMVPDPQPKTVEQEPIKQTNNTIFSWKDSVKIL